MNPACGTEIRRANWIYSSKPSLRTYTVLEPCRRVSNGQELSMHRSCFAHLLRPSSMAQYCSSRRDGAYRLGHCWTVNGLTVMNNISVLVSYINHHEMVNIASAGGPLIVIVVHPHRN